MKRTKEDITIRMMLKAGQTQISLDSEWNGHLGSWFIDVNAQRIYLNPLFLLTLGYKTDDIHNFITLEDLYAIIHQEDVATIQDEVSYHLDDEASVLEVNFSIQGPQGTSHQYYISGKLDDESVEAGHPFIIGTAYDVSRQYMTKKELKKQSLPLHQASKQDPLTGVLSRDNFEAYLHHAITLARAGQQGFCLIVVDLDFFKNINEHFGRDKGDMVLEEVGSILKKETRTTDYIGRTGGDNFQIVLSDVDFKTGQLISERIRKSIANHMFVSGIRITISGGLVRFKKQTYEDLINSALSLLKLSKQNGHDIMSY